MTPTALTIIHKLLRRELFDISHQLSCADTDDATVVRLQAAIAALGELLRGHGAHEEATIEPILRKASEASADRLRADHLRLDGLLDEQVAASARLADLAENAREAALLQLYLDWNRFVAAYLSHLDDEERTFVPLLGPEVPPLALVAESAASLAREQESAFLARLWNVLTPQERGEIERAREPLRRA
jgi:ABC-type transporter Mla subunit MlaD